MRKPFVDVSIFKERRDLLGKKIKGSALIIAGHPEGSRGYDLPQSNRADSNLIYLTGFEEPHCFFIFRPGQVPETVMFVRPRDLAKETWNGFRFGPELTESLYNIDKAYPIDEFAKEAPALLKTCDKVYYRLFKNQKADELVADALETARSSQGRTGYGILPIFDACELIGEYRLFKSDWEITQLRIACDISSSAHLAAMKYARPGINERQVHGVLLQTMMNLGANREGYKSIVATGKNATTLHYSFNDQQCNDGELILIDAGAEYNYYSGDITRTWPVNGRFTADQKAVYQGVLEIQKKIISTLKPGIFFKDLHETASQLLTDLMLDLGLLTGRKDDLLESSKYKKYYPHGIGHWLGLDVHDAGKYFLDGNPRCIEPGMVFTIEPGLYIPFDDESAAKGLRGIGVRIEDNILITPVGNEVLTQNAPKEIADLERIICKI